MGKFIILKFPKSKSMKSLVLFMSLIFTSLMGFLIYQSAIQWPSIPEFSEFQNRYIASDRLLLDRHGLPLHEIRVDHEVRRMNWLSLPEISENLVKSVILAEDKRFYFHPGFDVISLIHASFEKLFWNSQRGASTITMQVTDYLESMKGKKKVHRGFVDKIKQIILALKLEHYWTKQQILEAYFNLLQFKGELQGISSTTYGLYGKNPGHLDIFESVVLAVLIRSPNSTKEKLLKRACYHLKLMNQNQNCGDELNQAVNEVLKKEYSIQALVQEAPHVAQYLQNLGILKDNVEIKTTLDLSIQRQVSESLRKNVLALKDQNMNDGAAVVLDNATGDVIAYVGNIGSKSSAKYVDGARALRQAGSTLKPFIYGLAFDRKILTPSSIIDDSPYEISEQTGLYRPQNYDRSFRHLVTVRTALASSLNIPAVKAIEMVGVTEFLSMLENIGITDLEREEFYGPSLALGSADVKLIELTNAYRAIANKGVWSPLRWMSDVKYSKPGETKNILSESAAYLISDVLSDREARSATFGLENMLATRFWTAVKTGTSKDMRDNWCVGFSEKYTVGVWSGNFSGNSMWNVSGIQGAAPVWLEIMNYLHQNESSHEPSIPKDIVRKKVFFEFLNQEREEKFISGTEPLDGKIKVENQVTTKISYPLQNALIAIDPDIPLKNQKVFFNIKNPMKGHKLELNNKSLGSSKPFVLWSPKKGRFILEIKDQANLTLDKVEFEVRGRQ